MNLINYYILMSYYQIVIQMYFLFTHSYAVHCVYVHWCSEKLGLMHFIFTMLIFA